MILNMVNILLIFIIIILIKYMRSVKVVENISYFDPSINNPFMNYILDNDNNKNINKKNNEINNETINIEKNNEKIKKLFRQDLYTDANDIWGKNLNDRNFYTMPNTNIVNNQTEFAKWCYNIENSGQCKSLGINCLR